MGIYYKATRVNGFDFYSETVDYAGHLESGELLPEKDGSMNECCSAGVYHASTSKADTLIGGFWPCRLFEVEGEPVAEEGNKRGFLTLKVVRELPAWEALGPNGQAVAALIEKVKTITATQANAIATAQYAAWSAARSAAWSAACSAAQYAAWSAARSAARSAAWSAACSAAQYAACSAARSAAGGAAGVMVVRDLISDEHFNVIYGPWGSVMDL